VLFVSDKPWTFDIGLVPSVFLGSFLAALLFRALKLEGFPGGASMRRYIAGAMQPSPTACSISTSAASTTRPCLALLPGNRRPRGSERPRPPNPSAGDTPMPLSSRLTPIIAAALLGGMMVPWAAQADMARAEEIVQGKCFICHGAEGESSSPAFPRLAGQNASYVQRQLSDYKSGKRKSSTMQPMVEDLSPEDFKALGEFFASRPAQGHAVEDQELAQVGKFIYQRGNPYEGVASCATCHGADGRGSESLPRLAGQHAQYIENQLKSFNKRERTNDNAVMHAIASKLGELEQKSVAAYLSGLK